MGHQDVTSVQPMTQDDPFFDLGNDHTVVMPTPGARMAPARPLSTPDHEEPGETLAPTSGLNPLLAAANPLLNAVPQLRNQIDHPDPEQLRRDLARAVREFESRARALGLSHEHVVAARYILCTLLDETVASTPWGPRVWARQSLLVEFHNEAWGGEKVFQLLSRLAENPAGNRNVLELIYVCLALGFEGRYRVVDGGRGQLDTLKARLYQLLRKQQGEPDRALSPSWKGLKSLRYRGAGSVPLWVTGALCALILTSVYLYLRFDLSRTSDWLAAEIAALRLTPPVATARAEAPAPPRLARLLAAEIDRGWLEVSDYPDRSVVRIRADGLFQPGSDLVARNYAWLILRVAEALSAVPGRIEIAGHTDAVPIRTLRFPSNWELSQSRAESVRELLALRVPVERLRAIGRADTQPIAPNDTPEQRALNRRVDITLYAGASAEGAR